MKHVEIIAKCKGDKITAISETHKATKGYKNPICLEFQEGYSISIKPESDVQDLISIQMLKHKIYESESNNP